jgi:hypothetical protein
MSVHALLALYVCVRCRGQIGAGTEAFVCSPQQPKVFRQLMELQNGDDSMQKVTVDTHSHTLQPSMFVSCCQVFAGEEVVFFLTPSAEVSFYDTKHLCLRYSLVTNHSSTGWATTTWASLVLVLLETVYPLRRYICCARNAFSRWLQLAHTLCA